jgi:phospholipid/cholesterol/gamma-HCH transport system substrate-binding protein
MSLALFNRWFTPAVPVTLASERSGLMMEVGGKVKMRGVEVGRVGSITGGKEPVSLGLEIDPDQLPYIPANVEAEIKATTAFGNKYVDLVYPESPSPKRLSAGDVLFSRNVSVEVNTVLENLVDLLDQIDPAKLNAILSSLAEGLRGQGERIGEAISAADGVLKELNPRNETVRDDLRSLASFSDTYGVAAQDILATLDAASTTSTTLTNHADDLDALLLNVIGLSRAGIDLIGPNQDNLVRAVNILEPTTNLLLKYNPEYTCLLVGAKWYLDNGGYHTAGGGNGYSLITDSALLLGNDPYIYPDNLPIVAAKGGPGGKPSCGSLPDATKNFPVPQLVTNTGWGTGIDIRPNIGLGHPCWGNWLPVTRAVPQEPALRCPQRHPDAEHWSYPSPGLVTPPPGPLPLPPPPPAPRPGPPTP